jgi:hypothetical protein
MTLLTQDGKPYRVFSEPNPILKDQESLEKEALVFHNFKWQPDVIAAPKRKVVENPIEPPVESPKKSEEIDDFVELLKRESKALKAEKPKPPIDDSLDHKDTVVVYCHPAIVREKKDELYGEIRKTIQYGEKFTFDALILDSNGLEIKLFAKTANIGTGSILYPSKYKDGEKLEHYRWWKVVKTQPSNDGFLILGELTENQRDFSD